MTGPRNYSAATRAALALLSRGRCYNPDCERPDPIIVLRGGEPYIHHEIAQVSDAEPGNRYVADMTVAERRAFANRVHPESDPPVASAVLGRSAVTML